MRNLVLMQQVHGDRVVIVDKKDIGTTIPNCDGLITQDPNITLCVRVADCLPITLVDKKSRAIGIIHAGWRGLDNGLIGKTIKKIVKEFSSDLVDLKVSIGPHICKKHYEVKNDVSSKFSKYPEAILIKDGREFLNLGKIAQMQLVRAGVKKENIKIDKRCTFEDKTLYSYRRNKTHDRNIFLVTPRGWN